MAGIQLEKKAIRQMIKAKKAEFSLKEKKELSFPIFDKIETLLKDNDIKTILLYWSMDDEVFTQDFINKWYKPKTILLPKVDGDNLLLSKYDGIDSMIKGEQFGILEPNGEIFTDFNKIDMMIVPGVAFDKECNRMGRGRGFYDRLLKNIRATKIGVGFDFQIVDKVPTESFDIKMDKIITTSSIFDA